MRVPILSTDPYPDPPPPEPEEPEVEAPPAHFGRRGQLVVDGDVALSVTGRVSSSGPGPSSSGSAAVGLDYMLLSHFSVGMAASVWSRRDGVVSPTGESVDVNSAVAGLGPRVGVNLPLGRYVSFYPRLWIGYQSELWRATAADVIRPTLASVDATSSLRRHGWAGSLYAPILVHFERRRVFLGLGPRVSLSFAEAEGTRALRPATLGVASTLGATFGGPDPLAGEPAASGTPTERRFGDRGVVALMGNLGTHLTWSTFSHSSSDRIDLRVAPSLDVFVWDRISVGGTVGGEYTRASVLTRFDHQEQHAATSFFIGPRVGVAVPVTQWLDLYPRAGFSVGTLTSSARNSGVSRTAGDYSGAVYAIGLGVSALLHVREHVFVGLTPWIERRAFAGEQDPYLGRVSHSLAGADASLGIWL